AWLSLWCKPRATKDKGRTIMNPRPLLILATMAVLHPATGVAQGTDQTPPSDEIGYIFNTFMFLVTGVLVFWMAAGFSMLEAGLVRSKNVTMQLTKNIALF